MTKRLLIEHSDGRTEFALMRDRDLLAFFREQPGKVEAEQIYLGKVDRMVKGVEAAFVKLGGETTGFLPYSECRERPRSGEKLLLQVKRPPVGEKAAYLTADLALAGRYVLLTPLTARCAVSNRIEDPAVKNALRGLALRLAPPGMGLVMRAESAGVPEADVAAEIQALRGDYESILVRAARMDAPGLVKGRGDLFSRLLRDEQGGVDEILTDRPGALPPVSLPVTACESPFALYNARDKLEKSLQRKVWLPCGGYLVIDPTEAMTVIDVNSGKFTGKKSGAESTFLQLNREAAREIARLLRLRGVGGIVIIDFVDMESDESRAAVAQALRDALRDDPVKTVIHGFTALGLMELTRKKSGE